MKVIVQLLGDKVDEPSEQLGIRMLLNVILQGWVCVRVLNVVLHAATCFHTGKGTSRDIKCTAVGC